MARIKEGAFTGLYDANGEEINAGNIIYTSDGQAWEVNTYRQAVPLGDGHAVKLSDLLRGNKATLTNPNEVRSAAEAFKEMGNAVEDFGKAVDSLFPETEKDGQGNIVVTEPVAGPMTAENREAELVAAIESLKAKNAALRMENEGLRTEIEELRTTAAPDTLDGVGDESLAAALRVRGWDVKCTKMVTIEI